MGRALSFWCGAAEQGRTDNAIDAISEQSLEVGTFEVFWEVSHFALAQVPCVFAACRFLIGSHLSQHSTAIGAADSRSDWRRRESLPAREEGQANLCCSIVTLE